MPVKKKTSGRKRRHTQRKMKGGYYGFNGALATGAPSWSSKSEYGGNQIFADGGTNSKAQYGRGRKRRTGRSRKMKGGGSYGASSASFEGKGSRGLIDVASRNTKGPAVGPNVSKLGAFNDNGAHSGNWNSFKGLLPK
jgi:hypothetical protein